MTKPEFGKYYTHASLTGLSDICMKMSSYTVEQKNAAKELARLASFPRLNPNPIVEITMQKQVVYANPAMLKLFPNIKTKGPLHLLISGLKPYVIKNNGILFQREIRIANNWYRQSAIYIPETNSIRIYNIDITQIKQLEEQKDEFLGIAAHELKTPITSIKAYIQLLEKTLHSKGDSHSLEMLIKVDNQVNKFIRLISDLMDLTKIQSGRMDFCEEYFDFNEVASEVVEEVQRISPTHKIIVKFDRTKIVYGDKERIGQVVTNFLTNAIKYSPENDKICLKTKLYKHKISLFVQDFGIGIAKAKQKKVFERFYRVGAKGDRVSSGLGLYISSEIIKKHEGTIGLTSKKGKGSTFYFSLPLKSK